VRHLLVVKMAITRMLLRRFRQRLLPRRPPRRAEPKNQVRAPAIEVVANEVGEAPVREQEKDVVRDEAKVEKAGAPESIMGTGIRIEIDHITRIGTHKNRSRMVK
jgi:hypothetical protein